MLGEVGGGGKRSRGPRGAERKDGDSEDRCPAVDRQPEAGGRGAQRSQRPAGFPRGPDACLPPGHRPETGQARVAFHGQSSLEARGSEDQLSRSQSCHSRVYS